MTQNGMVLIPEDSQCLDSIQLQQLEESFREWAKNSLRADIRFSRRRILVIFLLIRYTGAKLNEVLALDPLKDMDFKIPAIRFRSRATGEGAIQREVHISTVLCSEIRDFFSDPLFPRSLEKQFQVDPGFVRLKFYDRAQASGFSKYAGGPEMIRKARAVELMQGNMPIPVVQKMLGHSTPNQTSAYVSFSEDDIQAVTKLFIERETNRKTSARNSFFCKIQDIHQGSIQTLVFLSTLGGHMMTSMITNTSLEQLSLKKGRLVTAEIKAPWIIIQKGQSEPASSADNHLNGTIERINKGSVSTEYIIRISDGTSLCAIVSSESARQLALNPNDPVWAIFTCFSVVLNAD